MVIMDGFIAGAICGVSGFCILLIVYSMIIQYQEAKSKQKTLDLINNLEKNATVKEYKLGRETNENESDS